MLLLDEPAAGLSPAERIALTDLLLSLEPDITLMIIEHDMDIALTVAERVTMMHDGSIVVEGTPAEIRANQLVHDLYLGRSHGVSEPLLEIHDLNAYYGRSHALQGVRLASGGAGRDHRAQRHGQDDPVQGDHGPPAAACAARSGWPARRWSGRSRTRSAGGASATCRRDGACSRR